MTGVTQFSRFCVVHFGEGSDTVTVNNIRISFDIVKDIHPESNRAHIRLYNLSESSRKRLQEGTTLPVRLLAGYGISEDAELLFSGLITRVQSMKEGTDWVTDLSAGDGVGAKRQKRTKLVQKGGVSNKELIKKLLSDLGVTPGNLTEALQTLVQMGKVTADQQKHALSGGTHEMVSLLAANAGAVFSIQDGHAAFTVVGALTSRKDVVRLDPESGLIGSPELSRKGLVKARALIQQRFVPGNGVHIKSQNLDSVYQVQKVTYKGDTRGTEWYADLELLYVQFVRAE